MHACTHTPTHILTVKASPNHDAVAWRVVDDELAEDIMATIDTLGVKIRPNTFILPNTDAGGGVGYDDMLSDKNGRPLNPYPQYGTWVNGQ